VIVSLFGPFAIRVNNKPLHLSVSGHSLDLFKYLLIHAGTPVRRELLCELFWPTVSDQRRRSALNTVIWRLRNQLCNSCNMDLLSEGDAIRIEVGPGVSIDGHELSRSLDSVINPVNEGSESRISAISQLKTVVERLDQPFLDGLTSDWALIAREKYFEQCTRALAILMRHCGEALGQRLLAQDPFRESAHYELMWLYVLTGRRAQAIHQYRRCAEILQKELGIEPMAELRALYDHIHSGAKDSVAAPKAILQPLKPASFATVLHTIEQSRMELYLALHQQLS